MLGLAMMLAAVTGPMSASVRFDLSCLQATTSEIGNYPEADPERATWAAANMYYFGRLSGRDEETNWLAVGLDEAKKSPRTRSQYHDDALACLARLKEKYHAGMDQKGM